MKGGRGGISGTGLSRKSPLPPFFKGGIFLQYLGKLFQSKALPGAAIHVAPAPGPGARTFRTKPRGIPRFMVQACQPFEPQAVFAGEANFNCHRQRAILCPGHHGQPRSMAQTRGGRPLRILAVTSFYRTRPKGQRVNSSFLSSFLQNHSKTLHRKSFPAGSSPLPKLISL